MVLSIVIRTLAKLVVFFDVFGGVRFIFFRGKVFLLRVLRKDLFFVIFDFFIRYYLLIVVLFKINGIKNNKIIIKNMDYVVKMERDIFK